MTERCRACKALLPEKELLKYKNMPKSAQFFPDLDNISSDEGVDIVLKQCRSCGLVQATGNPVPYYRDVIRASDVSDEMKEFRTAQFTEWVNLHGLNGKKVIEIGCGHGEYIKLAKESGAVIYGLENAPNVVSECGDNVFCGFVEDDTTDIPCAPYDGFFCLNFLEHIPDPSAFLRGIAHNLSDNSCGLVEVPDFDMMMNKSLYSEFIQDHLSYFTADSLINILSNNGFEVVSLKQIWHGYILSADVRMRRRLDITNMISQQESVKRKVHNYLSDCKTKGIIVAGWGAGHQALANLSLLDMKDKIECVIDSARFKQNKLTPATHIPVVDPDILSDGKIRAVIIMAGSYSQEINSFLKSNYPDIERAILTEDFLICKE